MVFGGRLGEMVTLQRHRNLWSDDISIRTYNKAVETTGLDTLCF
jgi:hypothetical protein